MTRDWMALGSCRNLPPDTMFPRDGLGVLRAKTVCSGCPCLQACLDYALDNHITLGVWGGTSVRERRQIRKQRRAASPTA
jgi:WhiB family transcriptional regulator, redox-sensing transcriptional regulator